MDIESLTQDQIDLMLTILITSPLFSVATIPEDHKHYAAKEAYYAKIRGDIEWLAELGFVKDATSVDGDHLRLNAMAEKLSGYKYRVYAITELGIQFFQGLLDDLEKETKYKNSIN